MKLSHIIAGFLFGLSAGALVKIVSTGKGEPLSPAGMARAHMPSRLRGRLIQMPGRA